MAVIVGGAFALTVKTKLMAVVRSPSLTVIVIVVVPLSPGAGVRTTLRSAPLPVKLMFASGTSVIFEEVPDIVKLPGSVSASPIVKGIGGVATFSFVD